MQQDTLAPRYVRQFQCTGSKCPDNCCHSWNVGVDPGTWRGYKTNPALIPLMQDKLIDNQNLATKEITPGYIKLDLETNQCTLQEPSGLCKLQKDFGEAALCKTCDNYPRSFKILGDDLIGTLTDSCPEAARLLVNDPDAMELEFGPLQLPSNPLVYTTEAPNHFAERYQLLQTLITLLRYRGISLEMRLFICGLLIQRAQTLLDEGGDVSMQQLTELFVNLTGEGYFNEQAKELSKNNDPALGLVILQVLIREKRGKSAFNDELQTALQGLEITNKTSLGTQHIKKLQEARKRYLNPLEKKQGQALENLVVNWLLRDLFPIQKKNLNDGWAHIMARYFLLKTLICGVALKQKNLNKKDLARIAYRFGRGVSHSQVLNTLLLELAGRNLDNATVFSKALDL